MSLVAANVDEELLAYGFVAEFVAGHFDLYDDTFGLQDQIHSPMSPCGAWRVLLCPHILEVDEQETVQKILDIVLVGYSKGLSSIVASAELPSNVVKALQDCPDSMQGRFAGGNYRRGLLDRRCACLQTRYVSRQQLDLHAYIGSSLFSLFGLRGPHVVVPAEYDRRSRLRTRIDDRPNRRMVLPEGVRECLFDLNSPLLEIVARNRALRQRPASIDQLLNHAHALRSADGRRALLRLRCSLPRHRPLRARSVPAYHVRDSRIAAACLGPDP